MFCLPVFAPWVYLGPKVRRGCHPLELWVLCGCWDLNLGSSVQESRSLQSLAISVAPGVSFQSWEPLIMFIVCH